MPHKRQQDQRLTSAAAFESLGAAVSMQEIGGTAENVVGSDDHWTLGNRTSLNDLSIVLRYCKAM